VVADCRAVTSRTGTRTLNVYDESWSHSLLARSDKSLLGGIKVSTVSLTTALVEARSICGEKERLVVKIDAEGSEYEMLLNTPANALSVVDELFLEVHWYAEGDPNMLLEHLLDSGLCCSGQATFPPRQHTTLHLRRPKDS